MDPSDNFSSLTAIKNVSWLSVCVATCVCKMDSLIIVENTWHLVEVLTVQQLQFWNIWTLLAQCEMLITSVRVYFKHDFEINSIMEAVETVKMSIFRHLKK